MTARDFCFWLQGYFEITKPESINLDQLRLIQRHLNLVFVHEIDPSMGDQEHQEKLNKIHQGGNESHIGDFRFQQPKGYYQPKADEVMRC